MTEIIAYRPQDACRAIGCGITKLYELIGQGKIEARRTGNITLIPAESLRRYVANLPPADIRTGQKAA